MTKKKSSRLRRQTKDRVLQARIPNTLDEELRDRARDLGLSVSTVVRNVLLNTFDLVEGVVTDSSQIARALKGDEREPAPPSQHSSAQHADQVETVGWQELTLNQNAVCEQCNTLLARGTRAAVGIPLQRRALFLCLACLAALQNSDAATGSQKGKRPVTKGE